MYRERYVGNMVHTICVCMCVYTYIYIYIYIYIYVYIYIYMKFCGAEVLAVALHNLRSCLIDEVVPAEACRLVFPFPPVPIFYRAEVQDFWDLTQG